MEQEYFKYLDELKRLNHPNMYGAGRYLQIMFDLEIFEANKVLLDWMSHSRRSI